MIAAIETFTGSLFTPLEPVWADIRIADIAHALAGQCRFSGHTRHHYSVAEHSVRVSELLEAWGYRGVVPMWGLLHDASEAYLVDLPTPLKQSAALSDGYRAAETRLMAAICKRFSLPALEPPAIRRADQVMLATEVRDLMHGDKPHWEKLEEKPIAERIRPWSPPAAEYEFTRRYQLLGGVTP